MHIRTRNSVILTALFALSTLAGAQKIYKCGTVYSQMACPDGVILPAIAAPDRARKDEADRTTRRDALTADRMEKSRLQQEKRDLAANTPDVKRQVPPSTGQERPASSGKKPMSKKKKEEFRAVVPGSMQPKKHTQKKINSDT
jgi:hypothetical protein